MSDSKWVSTYTGSEQKKQEPNYLCCICNSVQPMGTRCQCQYIRLHEYTALKDALREAVPLVRELSDGTLGTRDKIEKVFAFIKKAEELLK